MSQREAKRLPPPSIPCAHTQRHVRTHRLACICAGTRARTGMQHTQRLACTGRRAHPGMHTHRDTRSEARMHAHSTSVCTHTRLHSLLHLHRPVLFCYLSCIGSSMWNFYLRIWKPLFYLFVSSFKLNLENFWEFHGLRGNIHSVSKLELEIPSCTLKAFSKRK